MSNPYAFSPAERLDALHGLVAHPPAMAASDCTSDQSNREGDDAIALLVATIETYYLGWSMVAPLPPPTKYSNASARHQRATSDLAALLKAKAPAAPPCFDCRDTWLEWLHSAEQSNEIRVIKWAGRSGPGEAGRGRTKTDELSEQIDFCRDCTPAFKARQEVSGLCANSSPKR